MAVTRRLGRPGRGQRHDEVAAGDERLLVGRGDDLARSEGRRCVGYEAHDRRSCRRSPGRRRPPRPCRASASGAVRGQWRSWARPEARDLLVERVPVDGPQRARRPGTDPRAPRGHRAPAGRWTRCSPGPPRGYAARVGHMPLAMRGARRARPAPRTARAQRTGTSRPDPGNRRARDERARVLGAGGPLQHRFGEISGLAADRDHEAQEAAPPTCD